MKSPYPPYAEAELRSQPATVEYNGEVFWYDPVTGHTFDTVETGDATVKQIYEAYRLRHGLPAPNEK